MTSFRGPPDAAPQGKLRPIFKFGLFVRFRRLENDFFVDVLVLLGSSAWTSIVGSSDLVAEDDFGDLSPLC